MKRQITDSISKNLTDSDLESILLYTKENVYSALRQLSYTFSCNIQDIETG